MTEKCSFSTSIGPNDHQWECKRNTGEYSTDRCDLHLKEDELKKVDNHVLLENLHNRISGGENRFIGININEIGLDRSSLDESDISSLIFIDATVEKFSLRGEQIPIEIAVIDSTIEELDGSDCLAEYDIEIGDSTIDTVDFSNSTFRGDLEIGSSEINGNLNLSGSTTNSLSIKHCTIQNVAEFRSINSEYVDTVGTNFNSDVNFSGCSVREIHSHSTKFGGETRFIRSEFEKATHFTFSAFHETAEFYLASLGRDADFRGVDFFDDGIFRSTEIFEADFQGISVTGNLYFNESVFVRVAKFGSKNETDFNSMFGEDRDWEEMDIGTSKEKENINDIIFRSCTFEDNIEINQLDCVGDINFTNSNMKRDLTLTQVDVSGDIILQSITVDSRFNFRDVSCSGELDMRFSQISSKCDLIDVEVENITANRINLQQSIRLVNLSVESGISLNGSTLQNVEFEDGSIQGFELGAANVSELHFHGTELSGIISMTQSKITKLHINNDSEDFSWVNLAKSKIEGGIISLPENGTSLFDLSGSRIGDIDIRNSGEGMGLDYFQFSDTIFDGFDFTKYRNYLNERGWEFQQFDVDTPDFMTEKESPDPPARAEFMYRDMSDPIYIRERTYARAKNGAISNGNSKAASEFLKKELREQRNRHRETLINETLFVSPEDSIRKDINSNWTSSLGSYLRNLFLDKTSSYGEEPIKIAGWTVGTILLSAVIYPATQGIRESSTGDIISYQDGGNIIYTFLESLYFSIVTFTTLGYGDYQPVGYLSKTMTSIESIAGVFFAGLFIYSLGKMVTR